jgi:hypothetical protein
VSQRWRTLSKFDMSMFIAHVPSQNINVTVRTQVAAPPPASSLLDNRIIWPDNSFLLRLSGDPISSGVYGAIAGALALDLS